MQKKSKRLAALLLSLLMVISMIPVNGLTVAAAANPKLAEKSVSTVIGGTSRIKIKNAPIGATITYRSAKESIATVSQWGEVEGIKSGTTNIIVFVKKNSKTTKMIYKINVKKPELSQSKLSLRIGNTSELSVKNKPKKATYSWSSDDPRVATIDKNGKVTAKAAGTTTIKGKVKTANETYSLSCKVTVTAASGNNNSDHVKQTYTVTFNSNGGSPVASQTVQENTQAVEPKDPTRSGYTFDGWFTKATEGKKFDFSTAITENITLYARWSSNNYSGGGSTGGSTGGGSTGGSTGGGSTGGSTGGSSDVQPTTYTVTFYLVNGGSVSKHSSATVTAGDKATAPGIAENIGYTFDGWYTDEGMSAESKYDFGTAVDQNLKLYARWKPNTGITDNAADHPSTVVASDDKYALSADKKEVLANVSTTVAFSVHSTLTTDHFELFRDGVSTGVFLYDDGNFNEHHDDIPNDGHYTGTYDINIVTEKDVDVEFTAQATIGSTTIKTNVWSVFVYNEITAEETGYMDGIDDEITALINKTPEDAPDAISTRYSDVNNYLAGLVTSGAIRDVHYEEGAHAFRWTYCANNVTNLNAELDAFRFIWEDMSATDGVKAGVPDVTTDESDSRRGTSDATDDESTKAPAGQVDMNISKGNVVILNYYDENHAWSKNYDQIGQKLDDAGFSVEYIYDFECKDFMNLQKYNSLILLDSHGNTLYGNPADTPMICTQEAQTIEKNKTYSSDIKKNRIRRVTLVGGSKVYWISPELFKFYYAEKSLSNPIVNLGCCRNFPDGNDQMVKAIKDAGASAVCGYSATVSVGYDYNMANVLVERLLAGDTVDAALAFAKRPDQCGSPDNIGYDSAWGIHAVLNCYGNGEATLYHQLSNGAFEWDDLLGLNSLVSWKTYGDARSIYKLSGIKPKTIPKMAIISSGFGSMNEKTTSSIYQTFLVPEGATTLSFSYDVVSEEPHEWVGSKFNDEFKVEILNTEGEVLKPLVYESVNTSKWYAVDGIDFPGGDQTTYHTRWKDYSSDVLKDYQGQLIVIRFTVYDCGDAIYDTAALIDSISVGSDDR